MDNHIPPPPQHDRDELHALSQDTTAFFKKRIIMWVIRWIIGFMGIAFIVHQWSHLSWLWWAGAGVALLSLATMVFAQFYLKKNVAALQDKISALHDYPDSDSDDMDDETVADEDTENRSG